VAALEILDRRIDARGLAVDLGLVDACQAAWETLAELLRERLVSITDGAVQRETKTKDMAAWLRVQGLTVSEGKGGFDAAAVQGLLAEAERRGLTAAAQVLRLRLALGKTSLAKFQTLQQATGGDGRLRGSLQFYGAHGTGRWAGRLVQTQNMPKGVLGRSPAKGPTYDMARKVIREHGTTALPAALYGTGEDPTPNCPGVPAVLGSLLRTCFVAAPGKTLYVADWSAIEGRGVIWLADDQTGLRAFADKKTDVYCVTASAIFGRPITKEDMERNKYGKPTFLGAGYGLGAARAEVQFGFDRATAEKAIAAYRATFPGVPALWRGLERAALTACAEPGRTVASAKGRVHWYHDGRHLHCRLPSGRELFYREALVGRSEKYDTPCLSYCYENFTTKQWERGQIWGGVLTENIVQALCCDLLGESLIRLDRDGWHPVLTVHDEILCEEDQGDPRFTVEKLCAAMCVLPAWAKGFPIAAEGYAAPYWRK
jgi:DNA polymerase